MEEIFKPINGFDDYEVSNKGNVRSTKRKVPKLLKPCPIKSGYLIVGLMRNQEQFTCLVHRMEAEAFLPNPNNLPEVRHIDSNKANNDLSNLAWSTSAESIQNAVNNGVRPCPKGEEHWKSKMKVEDVKAIREEHTGGTSITDLATKYNVHHKTVWAIINNQTWKSVE